MVEWDEVALSPLPPEEYSSADSTRRSDSSYYEIWEEVVWKRNKAWWYDSKGRWTTKTVSNVVLAIDDVDPYLIRSLSRVGWIGPRRDEFVRTGWSCGLHRLVGCALDWLEGWIDDGHVDP